MSTPTIDIDFLTAQMNEKLVDLKPGMDPAQFQHLLDPVRQEMLKRQVEQLLKEKEEETLENE